MKDCIQKIHPLKFGEETCFNGILVIKPLSSGSEIGSCNWSIKSPKKTVAYLSNSIFGSVCAMEFDYVSLFGHDLVVFSDSSYFNCMDYDDECSVSEENEDGMMENLTGTDEIQEEREKMQFISSCIVESVRAGGSVLIPLFRLGIILPLLEHISDSLDSFNIKVPIYIISEKAEEMLSFTNAAPEWLCKNRQEKLFAGEPLFRHVALIKEGKISLHPKIYSGGLLAKWEEPCIVISPHWSLRFGAVVPLLHRWRSDHNSLLILEVFF
ncbi:hypothetical protein LUZ60_011292 [Juncus effusus]|nr:hypothetical protein LUZ60_011292 [Juncus effusus]